MTEDRAASFLRLIRRSQRGRLKVYLGYCAGVGKTCQMLQEGQRLKADGIDVVIGLLETHGRAETAKIAEGLESVPRRKQEYRGIIVEDMDPDAILTRKPQVVLIDELAHTNVPGSRNPKRYQDVQDILAEGIHVITTMNLQHLESLYNIVEKAVGVKVRERLPDSVLAEADQIVDVDLTAEDLRRRLEEGKIYPVDRVQTALTNFFTFSNLEKLRELTLRELASQIDLRRREVSEDDVPSMPDQIMVCLSSRGPNTEKLLRYTSRLAGKFNRNWYAVYVQTPSEEATIIDVQVQLYISETLTLAKQLGAMVFTYKGEDIADTILRFAREYRVGHIVIGRSKAKPFWKRFGRNKNILNNLIKNAGEITIIVLDTGEEAFYPVKSGQITSGGSSGIEPVEEIPSSPTTQLALNNLLSPDRIIIWNQPIQKEAALKALIEAVTKNSVAGDPDILLRDVLKREDQGSTFFNEGVAFPHVRVPGLADPKIALGLTKQGVSDVSSKNKIELIFLILSPAENPDIQLQVLGICSRASQNRHFLQHVSSAETAAGVMEAIENVDI